jgi:hypothetical protein
MDQIGKRLVQMDEEVAEMDGQNNVFNRITKVENDINDLEDQILDLMEKQQKLEGLESTSELEDRLTHIRNQIKKMENSLETKRKMLDILHQKERRMSRDFGRRESNIRNSSFRESETFSIKREKVTVPTNIPKFRQHGQFEEPVEFLEAFEKVLVAHEIPEERYIKLLPLSLDSVDGQWIKNNSKIADCSWEEIKQQFIGHFRNPNAMMVWQDQIRGLKVDKSGVQRYTDQFIRLANRLSWSLKSEIAIYQYKMGLPEWMLNSITASEGAAIIQGSEEPDVEQLGKIALRVEANSKSFRVTRGVEPPRNAVPICKYCKKRGHEEINCRERLNTLRTKENVGNLKEKPKYPSMAEKGPIVEKKQNVVEDRKPTFRPEIECYRCGKKGHIALYCRENKEVKAIKVGEQYIKKDNKDLEVYQDVPSPIEVPCLLNEIKVIGILDTGANVSVIDKSLVKELKLEIEPREGSISQAFKGNVQDRTGVVRAVIRVGKESANTLLEVADLHGEVKLLIGMDLFKQLGFKLKNVPFLWPNQLSELKESNGSNVGKSGEKFTGEVSTR